MLHIYQCLLFFHNWGLGDEKVFGVLKIRFLSTDKKVFGNQYSVILLFAKCGGFIYHGLKHFPD